MKEKSTRSQRLSMHQWTPWSILLFSGEFYTAKTENYSMDDE